jgi:hypothetical protein
MAEWLKARASKACIPLRVSGVRIPLSPPLFLLSLQWKHFDRRYADQSSINQIGCFPRRVPSSLKVDNESDLPEASPLGFLPIALNIAKLYRLLGALYDFEPIRHDLEHIVR